MNNKIKLITLLAAGAPLPASAQYQALFTELEANQALGGDAFSTPFFDTAAASGTTVYGFSRGLPTDGAAIVAFDTVSAQFSVVATPAQIAAASGGGGLGVKFGFTPINGGSTLRYLDFFGDTIYDTDIATGTTTAVASSPDRITANTLFLPDGSGFAYDSDNDRILSISDTGTFSELLNSTELTVLTGDYRISGSMGFSGNNLYIGSSQTDDLYFWDTTTETGGPVFSTASIDGLTDSDERVGFGDIFSAPDGHIYFYETDSDSIFRFDPADPDGSLTIFMEEATLEAGPGTDRLSEFFWLEGNLGWADDSDGAYVVPEPKFAVAALGMAAFLLVWRRRLKNA